MSQIPAHNDFNIAAPPAKGMAVAALVLGILGCIPLVGIVAIVLGAIAISRSKSDPQRFGGFGLALAGIICGAVFTLGSCGILGSGILLPALGQARQSARHLKSQSQLRQIGIGLHAYAADNSGVLPESEQVWESRLVPKYIPDAGVFQIPGHDSVTNPATYVYLPGTSLSAAANLARTVLVYESTPRPWKKRVAVLFVDGHVEDVDVDQLPSLLATSSTSGGSHPSRRGN